MDGKEWELRMYDINVLGIYRLNVVHEHFVLRLGGSTRVPPAVSGSDMNKGRRTEMLRSLPRAEDGSGNGV